MEVIRRGKDSCSFMDINVGDCFEVEEENADSKVYMKIAEYENGGVCVRAVDITSGCITDFRHDYPVIPIRAKAVIE